MTIEGKAEVTQQVMETFYEILEGLKKADIKVRVEIRQQRVLTAAVLTLATVTVMGLDELMDIRTEAEKEAGKPTPHWGPGIEWQRR